MSESPRPNRSELALEVARNGGFPEQPSRLSRRNRHVIVDADFHGDDAVVWFVRRGHSGEPVDEFWNMSRTAGEWSPGGGGGGTPGADLENRPSLTEVAEWREKVKFGSSCPFGFSGGGGSGVRGRAAYIHLQAAQEVAELRFPDREPKTVAAHGYVVLMFRSRRRLKVSAFDSEGQCLGTYTAERARHSWKDSLQSWLTDWSAGFSWMNR